MSLRNVEDDDIMPEDLEARAEREATEKRWKRARAAAARS